MKRAITLLLLLLSISPTLASPQVKPLKNGLTVILLPDPNAELATARVIVKAGSITEGKRLGYGMSHYLEHLVHSGTTSVRTEKAYQTALANLGGASNAYTTHDHTAYFINATNNNLNKAITLLYEWMSKSTFTEAEFQRERTVIHKEMERSKADISNQFYHQIQKNFYPKHPVRHPVLGYKTQFDTLTTADLQSYYNNWYVPENMILAIGGNFNPDSTLAFIEASFGNIPPKASPERPNYNQEAPFIARSQTHAAKTELYRVNLRFPTVKLNHNDLYALDLLEFILAEGNTALLPKKLIDEKKLVTHISALSYTPMSVEGYFEIDFETENQESIAPAIKEIWRIIGRAKWGLFSQKRLKRAKTIKKTTDILAISTIEERTRRAAAAVLYTGNPNFYEIYTNRLEDINKRDIIKAARHYLKKETLITTIQTPEIAKKPKVPKEATQALKPTLITLENGVRLLLAPDHSLPKITIDTIIMGGLRAETPSTNGIGDLLVRSFGKGSKKVSKSKFQSTMENKGAEYFAKLTYNTTIYSLMSLSEDLNDLLPLYMDAVLAPNPRDKEFEEIKRKSLARLKTRDESWFSGAYYKFMKEFYQNHPYSLSKLGEEVPISSLSKADIQKFHQRQLNPNTMIISLSGDFDPEAIAPKLKKYLGKLKAPQTPLNPVSLPAPHNRKKINYKTLPQDVAAILIGVDGTDLNNLEEQVKLDVLDAILSGMSYPGGRLHPRLRGEGLVYVVHAMNRPLIGKGMVFFYALTSPDKLSRAGTIIQEELSKIKNSRVSKEELDTAKAQVAFAYKDALSTPRKKAISAALNSLFGNPIDATQKKQALLEEITPKILQKTARLYLQNQQIFIYLPEK